MSRLIDHRNRTFYLFCLTIRVILMLDIKDQKFWRPILISWPKMESNSRTITWHKVNLITYFLDSLSFFRPSVYWLQYAVILYAHLTNYLGCTPTRAHLMTGRYTMRYGMQKGVILPSQPRGVPLTEKLMPEALKKCGYNTDIFGKWHLGMFDKRYHPTQE